MMGSEGHVRVKDSGTWKFPIKAYTKRSGSWVEGKLYSKSGGQWEEHGVQPINTINRTTTAFTQTGTTNYHGTSVQSVDISAPANHIIQGLQIQQRVNKGSDDDNDFNTRQIRARVICGELQAADWGQTITLDGSETLLASFNLGLSTSTRTGTADAGTSGDSYLITRIVVRHAVQTQSLGGDDDFENTLAAYGLDIYGKTSSVFRDVRFQSSTEISDDRNVNPQNTWAGTALLDVGANRMIHKIEFGGNHSRTGDDDDIGALNSRMILKITSNDINVALKS